LGLATYLQPEQPGYWGLLTSAQRAGLCQQLRQRLYPDCWAVQAWGRQTDGVRDSLSGLTDLLHRLGFCYKLTAPVPWEADAAAQAAFLGEQLQPRLAQAAAGQAVVYFAHAAPPPHTTRCTRAWTEKGVVRFLPTLSGRERVNLNAALNAHCPTQVHVQESQWVNAQSTRHLYEQLLVRATAGTSNCWYEQLLAAHPDGRPLYVICDNARSYQRPLLQKQGIGRLAGRQALGAGVSAPLLTQPEPD
jgi:hypothetical protein